MLCRSKSETQPRQIKARRAKPEIIHIRKPSLSNSVSSASSTSTARSPHHPSRRTPPLGMDPLSLHPAFAPPPRLSDRPFIMTQDDHSARYSGVDDDDVLGHYFEGKTDAMPAPPTDSPTPMQNGSARDEGGDYFMYKLHMLEHQEAQRQQVLDSMAERAPLNRSRWSESTIQTIDMDEDEESESDDESVLEMRAPMERKAKYPASWQNFSYKRDPLTPASPRRPAMKTMDSVEEFIKRGGWKRRGIVFNSEDVRSESSMF